ncbi:cell cycle protein [Zalerion maritima]|uniref:non-specific serine/threonine protein kinase n=1 Tax=Zalerion maritima TaxID=339359 RepID=A0AAD5WW76_9PEZI|nr:cell cycle protein [Zalerion maritima]
MMSNPTTGTSLTTRPNSFAIHDDDQHDDALLGTQDTDMMETSDEKEVQYRNRQPDPTSEVEAEDDAVSDSSEDEPIDINVQIDMDKLQEVFPSFQQNYRLIKRIGEGTFSTVYKAEDLRYESYANSWDLSNPSQNTQWSPPPIKRGASSTSSKQNKPRYVAIKKIYVTSSPQRILNELELLYELRDCATVCPLITAFRSTDQVVAILPYFAHDDFRNYFRQMTVPDIRIYFRSLFSALAYVHKAAIIHRDIKPTNFLYDPVAQRGVLVDFGLAEREFVDYKHCMCVDDADQRATKLHNSVGIKTGPHRGYPRNDTRPSRRANRAGTRGFRAPEVLFKCTAQSCKIDVWSVGVILLTIMTRRFPFFNSADDVEGMIELSTLFGAKRMKQAGLLHGVMLETDIPTIGASGFTLARIVLWSTCKTAPGQKLSDEEQLAIKFLERCLDLDPNTRISAREALGHEFLTEPIDEMEEALDLVQV